MDSLPVQCRRFGGPRRQFLIAAVVFILLLRLLAASWQGRRGLSLNLFGSGTPISLVTRVLTHEQTFLPLSDRVCRTAYA